MAIGPLSWGQDKAAKTQLPWRPMTNLGMGLGHPCPQLRCPRNYRPWGALGLMERRSLPHGGSPDHMEEGP